MTFEHKRILLSQREVGAGTSGPFGVSLTVTHFTSSTPTGGATCHSPNGLEFLLQVLKWGRRVAGWISQQMAGKKCSCVFVHLFLLVYFPLVIFCFIAPYQHWFHWSTDFYIRYQNKMFFFTCAVWMSLSGSPLADNRKCVRPTLWFVSLLSMLSCTGIRLLRYLCLSTTVCAKEINA